MATPDLFSKLPIASIVALLAAGIGTALWYRVPLEVSRPPAPHVEQKHQHVLQSIDARLWEDPLQVLTRHEAEPGFKPDPHPLTAARVCAPIVGSKDHPARVFILGVMLSNAPYADVAESRSRTRTAVISALRVAHFVPEDAQHIGAFTFPAPAGKLQPGARDAGKPESLLGAPFAFEVFRRAQVGSEDDERRGGTKNASKPNTPKLKTLVIWINEESVAMSTENRPAQPIERIAALMRAVSQGCGSVHGKNNAEVAVLGPVTSDTLRAMVQEVNRWSPQADARPAFTNEMKFYSPFATASGVDLLRLLDRDAYPGCPDSNPEEKQWPPADWRAQYVADARYTGSVLSRYFRRCGVKFNSTISTDEELARALVGELRVRDPQHRALDPGNDNYRVALISELDTYYGRSLPKAFLRAAQAHDVCEDDPADLEERNVSASTNGKHPLCRVLRYSYLRGLDGQGAAGAAKLDAEQKGSTSQPEAARIAASERAEGAKQFNSVRRLSRRLVEDDQRMRDAASAAPGRYAEPRIRAIGVLGTDVYDKIAILRAIRHDFPGAVLFTTDVDARMLDVDQYPYTRNVVVASSFGLELAPCLQKNIAPFRGVYQTSAFLAARVALYNAFSGEKTYNGVLCNEYGDGKYIPLGIDESRSDAQTVTQITINKWLSTPRLFEVGRTELLDLRPPNSTLEQAAGNVYPAAVRQVPAPITILAGALMLLVALGVLLLWRPARATLGEAWNFALKPAVFGASPVLWYTILVGIVILCSILQGQMLWAFLEAAEYAGEPFRWFEGLSMWPSELLRTLGFVLAVIFLFAACARSQTNLRQIGAKFYPEYVHAPRLSWSEGLWGNVVGAEAAIFDATTLWSRYAMLSSPGRCLLRATVLTAGFIAICWLLSLLGGYSNIPSRGAAAAAMHQYLTGCFSVAFLILLFFVADLTRLGERFSAALSLQCERAANRFDRSDVPAQGRVKDDSESYEKMQNFFIDSAWIEVRVVAARTAAINGLIFYPFSLLAILVIARWDLFDNWDLPPGVIAVLASSFLICCITAAMLQRTASRLRSQCIACLENALLAQCRRGGKTDYISSLIARVGTLREGAFTPILEQPVVMAALLPFASAGGLQLIQVLGGFAR